MVLSLCLDLLCRGACEEPPPQILQLSLLGIVVALQLPDGRGLTLDEFVFRFNLSSHLTLFPFPSSELHKYLVVIPIRM